MADKSFGVHQLDIIGTGTPTIQSPNDLNINADTVAISTSLSIGNRVNISSGIITASSGIVTYYGDGSNLTGISTFTGNIDANGDLDVDGHTNLDNVSITGVTTTSSLFNIREAHNTAYSATASPNALTLGNINSSAATNFTGIHLFSDGNGRGVVNLNALNNSTNASADFTIQTRHNSTLGERFRIDSSGGTTITTEGDTVADSFSLKVGQTNENDNSGSGPHYGLLVNQLGARYHLNVGVYSEVLGTNGLFSGTTFEGMTKMRSIGVVGISTVSGESYQKGIGVYGKVLLNNYNYNDVYGVKGLARPGTGGFNNNNNALDFAGYGGHFVAHGKGQSIGVYADAYLDSSPGANQEAIPLKVASNGTELVRVTSTGLIGLGGANYGTSGQVLTSNGSSSAPTWQTVSGGGGSGFFAQTTVGIHTLSKVGIGTTNPQAQLEINVGSAVTAFDIQGSQGQLFSVTNNLSSGSIFSVNDISGMPSIDVDANGTIQLAPLLANDKVGIGTTNPDVKLEVVGDVIISGIITSGGDLDVDGHTNLDNVSVAGVSTFVGEIHGSGQRLGSLSSSGRFSGLFLTDGNSYYGSNKLFESSGSGFGLNAYGSNDSWLRANTGGGTAGDCYLKTGGSSGGYVYAKGADGVELHHSGTSDKKLETTSSGVTVTGVGVFSSAITASTYIQGLPSNGGLKFYSDNSASKGVVLNTDDHLVPTHDSNSDLGLTGTRWRNVYADTLYGDGSNIVAARWTLGANGFSHYTFTGPGGLSSTDDPVIYLARGQTYEFVNNSGGFHPFQIRVSNGGSAYSTGVTNNGASSGTIKFEVPFSAPNTLYYQCTSHSGMGNTIVVYPDLNT